MMARKLAAFALVALAIAILFGLNRRERNEQFKQNSTAHAALCTFRADLVRRADDTEQFIREIETGVRMSIPGITEADLARSLNAQRSTVKSLAILDCKEEP